MTSLKEGVQTYVDDEEVVGYGRNNSSGSVSVMYWRQCRGNRPSKKKPTYEQASM